MTREAERKRLVELFYKANERFTDDDMTEEKAIEALADHLLDNGIVVPPCRVGDKVWLISQNGQYVYDTDVVIVYRDIDGVYFETIQNDVFDDEDINETVFLTREDAEAKLKEGGEE